MATQKGIITFSGTLEGITFYFLNGKPVARRAGGGFNAKAIKTSPRMARVRETSSEFGHCSRVKKVIKDALFPFFGKHTDASLHGRMMQLFMAIKDCDVVSERGKRNVAEGLQHEEGKKLLQLFRFTSMDVPYTKTVYDSVTPQLAVRLLSPEQLSFTDGTTHLELRFGILTVDFQLMKAQLYASDEVRVAKGVFTPNLTLTPSILPNDGGMKLVVVSYRYVQEVNGLFYASKGEQGFGVRVLEVIPGL